MSYETLLFEVHDHVAYVTLNRPDNANAINPQMGRDLMSVALAVSTDPSVRCVRLSSRGKMFCAGGDLSAFGEAQDELPRLLKELTVYLHAAISHFARMPAPVVAAVGGIAAGAGFSLVTAADLVIAGESARFTMAYTRAGLTPDGSSTYFLPRLIGRRRTLELMLTNRLLSAQEALEWGLVNRVVADEAVEEESAKLVRELSQGATLAYGAVKDLVFRSHGESLESQMEHESQAIARAARTEDAREGIRAFLAKRKASFTGR